MTICGNCGVELDEGLTICPLCGKYQGDNSDHEPSSVNYPSDIILLHRKENRKYMWELAGIIAFSAIAVCTIVDLVIGKRLSWSLFSDVIILASWVILTLSLYAGKRSLIIAPGLLLTILATLFVISSITKGIKWFFPVGLPLTVTLFLAVGTVIAIYKSANHKGLNIIASAFIVLSGFCIVTEMILDHYFNGFIDLRWSLITSISIFPVALLLFFFHYRMKKGNRLDSFFHI
ncbi:MAG TPA: hypothetical protein VJ963_08640 [Bacteroidales bacterium]|nr:hypothetical protein [Bacteroidales bacterium]